MHAQTGTYICLHSEKLPQNYFMLCLQFLAPAGSTKAFPHSVQLCSLI